MAGHNRFDWAAARARIAELGHKLERGPGDAIDVDRLLAERAERYRQLEQSEARGGQLMVVFRRGETNYAAPLDSISAIRLSDRITTLPGISPVIKGVVNARGQMAAVHDLASFAKPACGLPKLAWLLIGHGPTRGSALLADEVDDIRRFHQAEIRPVPLSLAHKGPGFVGATEDGVVILDPPGLLSSPEFFFA